MISNDFKTLAQRLSEGRLPVADALRYGMLLAESLRRLHDSGKIHGAVTPINLSMAGEGLDLLPAPEWTKGAITPYTAPEVLHGREADIRSDIYSFGAILFEMLTGRRAFEGETRVALVSNITHAQIPTSGSPAVDRLIGACLSKNPETRTPRMQKVIMELKLLSVAARRTEPAAGAGVRRDPLDSASVRTEIQQLEGRIAARFQAHERAVIDLQRSMDDAVRAMKAQIAGMTAEFAAAKTSLSFSGGGGTLDGASNERVHAVERKVEEMRQYLSRFERDMAADLVDIENSLKVQGAAIESSRTAMSQTDDLVERVVEALESLQSTVMDQGERPSERTAFVVN
ncbi:MAG TPA: protein kinase [Candidatus Solibacter sp.]